jgi:hypothetical protein
MFLYTFEFDAFFVICFIDVLVHRQNIRLFKNFVLIFANQCLYFLRIHDTIVLFKLNLIQHIGNYFLTDLNSFQTPCSLTSYCSSR